MKSEIPCWPAMAEEVGDLVEAFWEPEEQLDSES